MPAFKVIAVLRGCVQALSQRRLRSGSGVLVHKTLSNGLVDFLSSKTYRLSLIISVCVDRDVRFLDIGLESGLQGFVLGCFGRDNLNALLS